MEITEIVDEDERIAVLEKRVRDMEALVRGLTAELLDLRTVFMALSRLDGEHNRGELKKGTGVQAAVPSPPEGPSEPASAAVFGDERTVIRPKGESRQDVPVSPPEPAMVRIMQPDGTMKMEIRRGNKKTM